MFARVSWGPTRRPDAGTRHMSAVSVGSRDTRADTDDLHLSGRVVSCWLVAAVTSGVVGCRVGQRHPTSPDIGGRQCHSTAVCYMFDFVAAKYTFYSLFYVGCRVTGGRQMSAFINNNVNNDSCVAALSTNPCLVSSSVVFVPKSGSIVDSSSPRITILRNFDRLCMPLSIL